MYSLGDIVNLVAVLNSRAAAPALRAGSKHIGANISR